MTDRIRIADLRADIDSDLGLTADRLVLTEAQYDQGLHALLDAVEAARDMVTTAVLAGHPMSEELEAALGRFDFGDER